MTTEPTHEQGLIDGGGDDGSGAWIDQVRAFTERSLREVARNRIMLFWAFGFPPVMYLLFTELFGASDGEPVQQAILAVGLGTFGAMFVCLYVFGEQLATDVEDQRYEAFRALPISPSADLVGRMVSGLVLACGAFVAVLVTAALTGGSFGLRSIWSVPIVIVAGVLSCVLWMVVTVPIVAVISDEQYAEFITTGLAVGAFMLTGYNGVLPELVPFSEWLLNYLPNTLPTRLVAHHLIAVGQPLGLGELPTGAASLGLLFVYAIVLVGVGTAVLHRSLYKRGELL